MTSRGEHCVTGALGPMAVAAAGDQFTAHIEGLGTVTTTFASTATEGAAA